MAVNKNANYKVFNGTDFDTINLRTIAGNVSIADAGSKITATDVEGALQELATNIALKLNSSGYTASDVLAKLLTVDGTGTGLDADKLDGKELSAIWADSDIVMQNAQSGYIKFKNGLMIQWGKITALCSSYSNSLFYTQFPNYIHTVIATGGQDTNCYATSVRVTGWTTTGFSWDAWQGGTANNVGYVTYIAVGY